MLTDTKQLLLSLKDEINQYFDFLENPLHKEAKFLIINNNDEEIDIKGSIKPMLKSTAILLLYNLLEAFATAWLQDVKKEINELNLPYEEAIEQVQKAWLDNLYYKFNENASNQKYKTLHDFCQVLHKLSFVNFHLNAEKDKRSAEVSGSVDVDKLRQIVNVRFGVSFPPIDKETANFVKAIKDFRNNLAHGIISFEKGGQFKYAENFITFKKHKDDTLDFLGKILENTKNYFQTSAYKRNP